MPADRSAPFAPAPPPTPKAVGSGGGRVVIAACVPIRSSALPGPRAWAGAHAGPRGGTGGAVTVAGGGFGGDGGSASSTTGGLERGCRVRVEGLLTQPELNGLEGTVKKLLNKNGEERVWVRLDTGKELNVSKVSRVSA